MQAAIVVHGGAGAWEKESNRLRQGISACQLAAKAGQSVLLDGGSALDAVETAVRILEDSPVLDAGRGSYPNSAGNVEMDAMIMDGRTLNLGAVAAVERIRYPISLARRILEEDDFNFLVGDGANAFADKINFPRCALTDLLILPDAELQEGIDPVSDTVGAVAVDFRKDVATATSTGGTRNKLPGRVGDSPLVGAGGYADNLTAAVSATGRGEDLMKILISKLVCDFIASGKIPQDACNYAMKILGDKVKGKGGLIAVDALGNIGIAFNTIAMPYAYAIGSAPIASGH